uniref:hypothetical protein n=1 Tax=Wolbachia endosymbiont of Atemnus politus TaxID=2682840 RepID=UPI002103B40A|nr:hypothetical protein [Wolbachia endosymbiont of Atemnus politus]
MGSVSKFKELKHGALTAKVSWSKLEKQVTSLAKQIKSTENPSKTLKAEFDKAKKEAKEGKLVYLQKKKVLYIHLVKN